ncbi:AP-4 complex subunit epsilon-1-like isoform X2 [Argonauta hians]
MSDIVEKTLSSLPRLLSENLLGGLTSPTCSNANSSGYQYGTGLSRGFYNLMRNVEYARSVAKEQHIIQKDLSLVQQKLSQPDLSTHQIRDYLTRLIFCHMMGYDTSFGNIHAVKLAQQGSGWMKWMGYLSCGILLHEDHELIVLLVNTILKDLRSTNILDNLIALSAASSLVNVEMIPVVLPLVEEKHRHSNSIVRKKAVTALLKIWSKSPDSVPNISQKFSEILCDRDPGVVNASLICYQSVIKENPTEYKALTPAFLNILKQVLKRKLPAEYEYHSIPNPWMQISLLKLLSSLGANNRSISHTIYPVIKEVLQCANMKENMAFAIIYECILTITHIVPNTELLDEASRAVSKFLHSSNQNLKYLGMKSLTALVVVAPKYAVEYQKIIMEYLENPDSAIQRKTLELMYQIANPVNIKVISQHLLKYISKTSHDPFWQADIVAKLFSLVEKLSSCDRWYVDTINELLEVTKGDVPNEIVFRLLNVIDNASKKDKDFSHYVFTQYLEYLQKEELSDTIIQVSAWVISENPCEVSKSLPSTDIASLLLSHFCNKTTSDESRCWIWTAITKIMHTLHHKSTLSALNALNVSDLNMSSETNQRFQEVKRINSFYVTENSSPPLNLSLNVNESFTSELDFTLSFVDDYVSVSLENGAMPFKMNHNENNNSKNEMCLFEEETQDTCDASNVCSWSSLIESSLVNSSGCGGIGGGDENNPMNMSNKLRTLNPQLFHLKGIKKVWSKEGIIQENSKDNSSNPPNEKSGFTNSVQANLAKQEEEKEEETEDVKLSERQQFATALFAGISPQESFDTPNEKTKNLSAFSDKRHSVSPEGDFLSDFLKLRSNKKGFDWHSFSSKSPQMKNTSHENLRNKDEQQQQHDLHTQHHYHQSSRIPEADSKPDDSLGLLVKESGQGHEAEPPESVILEGTNNYSLYEEYYSMLSKQDYSKTDNQFVEKQELLSFVDKELLSEARGVDAIEEPPLQYVLPHYENLEITAGLLSSENNSSLNFTVLSEFEEFILKSCKIKTAEDVFLVLRLEPKSSLGKQQFQCQIQLTCVQFLKISIVDHACQSWSNNETSAVCITPPLMLTNTPVVITTKFRLLELRHEQLFVSGDMQLKEKTGRIEEKQFKIDLSWTDFCSGCSMDVTQFDDCLHSFRYERSVSLLLSPHFPSLSSYVDQFQSLLPTKCIHANENQVLLCGQCLYSGTFLCSIQLLRNESSSTTLSILLKADNRTLLNCLLSYLQLLHML